MTLKNLTEIELAAAREALPRWRVGPDALARDFEFADFNAAFGFMVRAALVAEKQDHHPDWRNVWKRVDVRLSTHDTCGVTARDVALAKAMDTLAG